MPCVCWPPQVSSNSGSERAQVAAKLLAARTKKRHSKPLTEEEKEKEAEAASAKKAQEWLDTGFGFNQVGEGGHWGWGCLRA
jgi:hypothetical protein